MVLTPFNTFMIILGVLIVASLTYAFFYSKDIIKGNPFLDKNLLKRGMDKPVIWLYYDMSDINSRRWFDFGSRTSRALNMPFLNLCYETIVRQNKDEYRIEVIGGLPGVAELLGGWEALPSGLRNPLTVINEAEINYIRSAILAKYGGLWLSPYSICLRPFGKLPEDKIVFFGTDLDETYSGNLGTAVPGFRCIWAPKAQEPFFEEWTMICYKRINEKRGGEQIRGDAKWDWVHLSSKYVERGIVVDVQAEGGRKKGGRRIQLEDIFAAGQEGNIPFDICNYTVYITINWPELRDREYFGWFLRMSEDQIMESDLAITHLLKISLN